LLIIKLDIGLFQRPVNEWTLEFRGLTVYPIFWGNEKETQFSKRKLVGGFNPFEKY